MACSNCGTGGCSSGGCGKSGGCATGGCNKLNTYDWLGNMLSPDQTEVDNIYEVRFKNTRKSFFRNVNGLRLYIGDQVVVESDRGYDVGTLSLGGVLAELQMHKKVGKKPIKEVPKIYRKANEVDLELLEDVRKREPDTLTRSREIIGELNLDMKLSDVEFQGDNAKAIFYYIADHRVDFRELIKVLAREFRIRVEMKQIGLRHEAGLVGGIGSCGRELCCSTWLTDFKTVSTSAARYQNLSLNPMKISGLCGRLKCCLNFELESYLDALYDFPEVENIRTVKGKARLQKTDIFKRQMWFSYENDNSWYAISVDDVKMILAENEKGEIPEIFGTSIMGMAAEPDDKELKEFDFVDVVGSADLLEERKREEKNNSRRGKGRRKGRNSQNRNKESGSNQKPRNRGNNNRRGQGNRKPKNEGAPSSGNSPTPEASKDGKSGSSNNRNRRPNNQGGSGRPKRSGSRKRNNPRPNNNNPNQGQGGKKD
ncbi:MAG: regulatory iron-sulfur-containing complex subunit RicT [Bacteroidota bacterium]